MEKEVRSYYEGKYLGSLLPQGFTEEEQQEDSPPEHLTLLWRLENAETTLWGGGWLNQPHIHTICLDICRTVRQEMQRVKEMHDEANRGRNR